MNKYILCFLLLVSVAAEASPTFKAEGAAPGNMRFAWIHGSLSAKHNTDVRVQVHQYNAHTFILRQNPAVHWEAPFMYLLFGSNKAILLDTGATKEAEYFPIRSTVDAVIDRWQAANGVSNIELVVMPLGSEFSQTQGISQFSDRSGTEVIAATMAGRTLLSESMEIDLGDRTLKVLPTPGIDPYALTIYDPYTDLLFTGNTFYAGRLVIRDFPAYKASIKKLWDFSKAHPVKWTMGGRIEMSDYPGIDYRLRSNYRPREHELQLPASLLRDCYQIVHLINGQQDIRIHDEFIVMNGVGRGARDYGWPTYTPERYSQRNLR